MVSLSNRKIIKLIFLVVLIIPTLFFVTTSFNSSKGKDLKIGKKMPLSSLEMKGVDGGNYALNDLTKTNGLVVVFSCNTCPFVVGNDNFEGWEKQYNDLHTFAKQNELGFVLVNSNEKKREGADSFEKMKTHHEEQGYTMKYLVDKNSEIANAFGAKTTPHVFVFNSSEKLVFRGAIDNSVETKKTDEEQYLIDVMNSMAKGEKIKNTTTPPRGCSIKRN